MSVEIAWKQNILVTDSYLLKLLLVVFGFGLQAFVCDFSRQNICSEVKKVCKIGLTAKRMLSRKTWNIDFIIAYQKLIGLYF